MKVTWLTLYSIVLTVSVAQGPSRESSPAFSAAGAFFALSVDDLDASTRWYSEKLGLRVAMRARHDSVAVGVLEGGGLIVELIDREGAVPLRAVAPAAADNVDRVHGYVKAGVIVDDWNGLLQILNDRGVAIAMGPFPKRADQRANLIIKDNSGNMIQFFGK